MEEQKSYWGVIPGEVFHDQELTAAAKLLYLVLSTMAHRNGYCWPSNEALAAEMNLSKRRVQELISKLQKQGYIRVSFRRAGGDRKAERRYIYCGLFVGKEPPPPSGEDDAPEEAPSAGELPEDPAEPRAPACGISHVPHAESRAPSCEIPQDPHAKSRGSLIGRKDKPENIPPIVPQGIASLCQAYAGEDGELLEAILGLLENRAALRPKPNPVRTERAMRGILSKLDRLSGGDRAAKLALLDIAVQHNWLTVYPLKPDELPASGYDEEGYDGI